MGSTMTASKVAYERARLMTALHEAYSAACVALVLNRQIAKSAGHDKAESPAGWLRNFCTVRLRVGLGAGHSELIARLANPGDLILVANPLLLGRMREQTRIASGELRDLENFSMSPDLRHGTIFVDDPTITLHGDRAMLLFYETAALMRAHTVVMIGE
jgi:hypothetical protein